MTHHLKLLDKMCKYERDPASIVEDTEWTRFCPQAVWQTDGQTDKVKPLYPPFNFIELGYKKACNLDSQLSQHNMMWHSCIISIDSSTKFWHNLFTYCNAMWLLMFAKWFFLPASLFYFLLSYYHDDVIKWKYFPHNWPIVWELHRWPVNSTHKGRWRGALMLSLICTWINDWVNNRGLVIWDAIMLFMTLL